MTLMWLVDVAQASGGAHDGGIPTGAIAWHAFNLFFLVALLTWLLRGKIRDAVANRGASIKRDIDDANTARKEAQLRFAELEARLNGFEQQLDQMKTDAETDAAAERENILARAEEDAARIRVTAERTIRDEGERARQVLRREVAELSVQIARERLESEVNEDDQQRLAGDFFDTVKGAKNGADHG